MECEINIKKPNQIVPEQIQVKKRISVSQNVYEYPLNYFRKQIIVQTPIVYIPHTTYKVNSKITFDFFFLNLKVDREMEQLRNFVLEMNKIVKNKIAEESKPYKNPKTKKNVKKFTIKPKEFISNIKLYKSGLAQKKSEMMRVNCYENIHSFDEYKRPISLDYLKAKVYLKLLLSPVKIWVHKEKFGIFWEVLQIKIYPKAVLNSYMFIDDDVQQQKKQTLMSSHPEYSKYFDMIKKGVPKQAVKNKMLLDGKDPNILDNSNVKANQSTNSINYSPSFHPPLPPPPLPLPSMLKGTSLKKTQTLKQTSNNKNCDSDKSQMFSELVNTVKRKGKKRPDLYNNLEIQSKERYQNNRESGEGSFGNYTPSLNEILKRRNTLRKTDRS